MKTCRENSNLFKIRQKYQELYNKTKVRCIVAGDNKLPQKRSHRVKWYQIVRIAKEV